MKKLRKDWPLGFLGFMSIYGIMNVVEGKSWGDTLWILWVIWFVYFIPVRDKNND